MRKYKENRGTVSISLLPPQGAALQVKSTWLFVCKQEEGVSDSRDKTGA